MSRRWHAYHDTPVGKSLPYRRMVRSSEPGDGWLITQTDVDPFEPFAVCRTTTNPMDEARLADLVRRIK